MNNAVHRVEIINLFHEHLDGLFNVMGAIEDRLFNFCRCQLPVKVKGNFRFLDVGTKKCFQRLQTNGWIWHDIIVNHGNLIECLAELPPLITKHNDVIIDFFGIQPQQDALENILIIVFVVESHPNGAVVGFIKRFQLFRVIDYDVLFFLDGVNADRQPIVFENFKVIKYHAVTTLLERGGWSGSDQPPRPDSLTCHRLLQC